MSEDGSINFSPSAERLALHFEARSMYRQMNDLRDLGFLSWTRQQNHYGRRIYRINIPAKTPVTFAQNTCHIRQEHLTQLRSTSVFPSLAVKERLGGAVCGIVEKPASPVVPRLSSKGKTPQQQRYGNVRRLWERALQLLRSAAGMKDGVLAELLKTYAAQNNIPCFDAKPGKESPIDAAITIARAKLSGERTAAAAG